jgi:hypothetical protein
MVAKNTSAWVVVKDDSSSEVLVVSSSAMRRCPFRRALLPRDGVHMAAPSARGAGKSENGCVPLHMIRNACYC